MSLGWLRLFCEACYPTGYRCHRLIQLSQWWAVENAHTNVVYMFRAIWEFAHLEIALRIHRIPRPRTIVARSRDCAIRPTPLLLLINTQHYSLFTSQYASYGGRHHLSRMSSILQATQLITRCRAYSRTQILRLRKPHMWFTQSRDCATRVRNLGIPRMHNAISRLHKFPDCAEHIFLRNSRQVKLPVLHAPRIQITRLYLKYNALYYIATT